jgi:hypothetical protein
MQNFRTTTGADGKVVTKEGVDPYLNNLPKESEWPAAGEERPLISPELVPEYEPVLRGTFNAGSGSVFCFPAP